ncbi:aminopeptidase [Marinithermus hydrothermalis]|uniref:Leucyl aminopeptidase n=1 Tax=Marinithermus hydrothermalis (strain DSM 14884 / JCM 11576 / T1) TaxID=869210 RepID=F2NQ49_MARHT|nr:leucyl aminopeptidase [Marinithermus hydrothermalis]AEB11360.1 leucyl aminopeptidase [Marinithermus hydrothermalis DSM 14884]
MNRQRIIDAIALAQRIVRHHLAVQPGENVLIVADPETETDIYLALAGSVQAVGAEYTVALMPTRGQERATRLTRPIERALEEVDVLIGVTRASGAPTYAPRVAELLAQRRIRALSMVMRDLDNYLKGAATADYEALEALGQRVAQLWSQAEEIRIQTRAGTDFRAGVTKEPVMGQVVIVECGLAREPGREAAFSDGEVSQRPRTGTSQGVLVVDGPVAGLKGMDPFILEVEAGRVVRLEGGGHRVRQLEAVFRSLPCARHIAEVGIGLNPNALRNGDFEEEKKALGNVHVALGSDLFYGGTHECGLHWDMVLYDASVWLDDLLLFKDGKLMIDETA